MIRRNLLLVLAVLVCLTFTRPAEAHNLSGCWKGSWYSCPTGHKGPMKASFCRINDNYYRVNFRGRFWKIVPFRYSVTLRVVSESDGTVKLAGSSNLGRLMGTFYYRATVSGSKFSATYSSKKDNGTFTMWRTSCCR